MSPLVRVDRLTRQFRVTDRDPGLRAALRSIRNRRFRTIDAAVEVSFHVEPGEIVGFLGPNGAGKTTVLKCVAGLLTPTSGAVEVLGFTPSERRPEFLRRLGFVMGQRWQLHPDLPVSESFEIHRVTYELERSNYERMRAELVALLDLDELIRQPARGLSLGQRMRCEFAAALLHEPEVVLLDEPTLGLDFEAQAQIRTFVREYATRHEAAVLLTSHYLADIDALSDRVLAISKGHITWRGTFPELRELTSGSKRLTVRLRDDQAIERLPVGSLVERTEAKVVLDVGASTLTSVIDELEGSDAVLGVDVSEPPIESTLAELYERDGDA